jgi:hypothetical protein
MLPTHRDLPTAPVPVRTHPSSTRPRHIVRLTLNSFFLSLLLLTSILSGWGFAKAYAFAGPPHAKATPGSLTFQKFLQLSKQPASKRAPFVRPQKTPPMPVETHATPADYTHLPPSAEPATMKPVSLALTSSFLTNGAGAKPFDVTGSDSRLEIQIPPGSLDVTHATTAKGTAPVGPLTLVISQIHGHYTAGYTSLGSYRGHHVVCCVYSCCVSASENEQTYHDYQSKEYNHGYPAVKWYIG